AADITGCRRQQARYRLDLLAAHHVVNDVRAAVIAQADVGLGRQRSHHCARRLRLVGFTRGTSGGGSTSGCTSVTNPNCSSALVVLESATNSSPGASARPP